MSLLLSFFFFLLIFYFFSFPKERKTGDDIFSPCMKCFISANQARQIIYVFPPNGTVKLQKTEGGGRGGLVFAETQDGSAWGRGAVAKSLAVKGITIVSIVHTCMYICK